MSYSAIDNVYADSQEGSSQVQEAFQLTPEEVRVLKDCGREGIIARAMPMGMVGGFIGYMGAKSGPLMSTKFGNKPAIIGLGLVGYFMGRLSYSRVCFDRALQVPNGTLRRFYTQGNTSRESIDPTEKYYATVDPYSDASSSQGSSFDIDIPRTSSFDTTPSDYYTDNTEALPVERSPQNYTSYDDLRKQNREEYSKRMYGDTMKRSNPQEPVVRRPAPPQAQFTDQPGSFKSKYGDVWDA